MRIPATTVLAVAAAAFGCSSSGTTVGEGTDGGTSGDGGIVRHVDSGGVRDGSTSDGGTRMPDGATGPDSKAGPDGSPGVNDGSTGADSKAGPDGGPGVTDGSAGPDSSLDHDGGSGGKPDGGFAACTTGCTSPPSAVCRDPNTLRSFGVSTGCIDELCQFAITDVACPFGCAGGACASVPSCTPGAARCSGAGVETCNSTGSAWLFQQTCPGTCTAGLCNAPCTANAVRCDGNVPETCSSDGTAWVAGQACSNACQSGLCSQANLVVDGTVMVLDGDQSFTQGIVVKNGGTIQVGSSGTLTLSAPTIDVGPGSFVTGTSSSCPPGVSPDDVYQGIRLLGQTVTIDGSVTWTGSACPYNGVLARGGTIGGSGSVSSTGRALLLYGTGGLASTIQATGATKSLMPPNVITSAVYPAGATYNDDGPPASFTWDKPFSTVAGYYYVIGSASNVPKSTSTLVTEEALASAVPVPQVSYLDIVTLDTHGVVGTVPHEFVVNINASPPALASSTNPGPGSYVANTDAIVSWSGGNAQSGYLYVLDRFPTTRPDATTGTVASGGPSQVLLQNLTAGQQWFHLVGQDALGYRTKAASHWELDVGQAPSTATNGAVAGTVVDATNTPVVGATVTLQRGVAVQSTGAGGVYTFGSTIAAGTYEVVAAAPGMQSAALTLTVTGGQTTDGNFQLSSGIGCPSCVDACAAALCTKVDPCTDGLENPWAGTCDQGACQATAVDDVACHAADGAACNVNGDCASGYCSETGVCYDGSAGSSCNASSQCAQGYCTSGKCSNGSNGTVCAGNSQCASGACVYGEEGYACAIAACASAGTNPCYSCCFPMSCQEHSNGYVYCEP